MTTLRLHFCRPGGSQLEPNLPPGSETCEGRFAPSVNLALPCGEFAGLDRAEQNGTLGIGTDLALPVLNSRTATAEAPAAPAATAA